MTFPYGISDFKNIITNNFFYCDRTGHIPILEYGKFQLFLRPRRFGKSLLLSMLKIKPELAVEALKLMRLYYNGYQFSHEANENVYNPTMTLYFLKYFNRFCKFPRKMLDANLAVDEAKLRYLTQMPRDRQLLLDIVSNEQTIAIENISDRFGIEQMLSDQSHDHVFFVSFLYYFGVLTIESENIYGSISLKVPNAAIKGLYVDRTKQLLLPKPFERDNGAFAAKELFSKGSLNPLSFVIDYRKCVLTALYILFMSMLICSNGLPSESTTQSNPTQITQNQCVETYAINGIISDEHIISPFNVIASPPGILAYPSNIVVGYSLMIICPNDMPSDQFTENLTHGCVICFYYGGTQDGIEKKYFKIKSFFETANMKQFISRLWIIRVSPMNQPQERFALILDPFGATRQDILAMAKELAIQIKKESGQTETINLNQIATILCNEYNDATIQYQPKLEETISPVFETAPAIQTHLKESWSFLQTALLTSQANDQQVVLALYHKTQNKFIEITLPKDCGVYKDENTGIVIVKAGGQGVASEYYVGYTRNNQLNACHHIYISAIAFPMQLSDGKITHEIYTPFSQYIHTDDMVQKGLEYLIETTELAVQRILERQVPSISKKGKHIEDILPADILSLILTLNIIEHIDHAEFISYVTYRVKNNHKVLMGYESDYYSILFHIFQNAIRKVFVTISANGENAYNYAMSSQGALGMSQIIRPTYESLLKLYPKAMLIPDFYQGARNHLNGIIAQILHIDSEISTLCREPLILSEFDKPEENRQMNIFQVLIAGYNFSAPKLKKILISNNAVNPNWKKRLPWETQLYIFKSQFVQKWIEKKIIDRY